MAHTRTNYPTQKVTAVGVAGAVSIVIIWALHQFAHLDMPSEVASAITTIIAFLAGYLTPPASGEVIDDAPATRAATEPQR
jgi:hypothetical protein